MVGGWKDEAYKQALAQVVACAKELGRRSCDFIIHGGAPLVLTQGKGFKLSLIEKVMNISGTPCTTSIMAAMDAFRDLSTSRLAVVDPYPPDLNQTMIKYLTNLGFGVASVVSLVTTFTESVWPRLATFIEQPRGRLGRLTMQQGYSYPARIFLSLV